MLSWLAAAALVVLVTRLSGLVARWVRLPFVIGELIGGVLLGPVILGLLVPLFGPDGELFGADVRATIRDLAQLAVVVFMVEVGYQTRNNTVRPSARSGAAMAAGVLVLPAVTGLVAAYLVPRSWLPTGASLTAFALVGAAVFTVTALPVLVLIMRDLGVTDRLEGQLALSGAALSDVVAWLALGAAIALQQHDGPWSSMVVMASLVGVYVAGLALRPLVGWAARRGDLRLASGLLIGGGLGAAAVATLGGAHPAMVGLLVGLAMADPDRCLEPTMEQVTAGNMLILMPFFIVQLGLAFEPSTIFGRPEVWLAIVVLCVLTTGTKLLGPLSVAGVAGVSRRVALGVGALSGAKGITEMLVLAVALEAGIIGPLLFSVGLVMTLINTVAVAPVWHLVQRGRTPGAVEVGR